MPLLDHSLVEIAASMPAHFKIRGRNLKHILKHALEPLLPREILYRKKRGFGALMGSWLKHELSGLLDNVLSRQTVEARGLLDWPTVESAIEAHRNNRADYSDYLVALLNLELWCRIFLDGQAHEDVAEHVAAEAAVG